MNRKEKEAVVGEVAQRLARAKAVILTDFSGLKVEQMTDLRQKLKDAGLDYMVVKNTLLRLASQGTGAEPLSQKMTGPNGLGFSYDDPVELAKVLVNFAKDNPKLDIKEGVLDGKLIDSAAVSALAKLPSREVLLAQLLGVMNGVARNFVSVLAAVPRGLVTALKQIEEQKAEAA
ncbi:50S ribosomal protein L10 [Desulfocarbo indianensis]|nr:50S ribosomal protein L10 [Desulfocarbo indianensis]